MIRTTRNSKTALSALLNSAGLPASIVPCSIAGHGTACFHAFAAMGDAASAVRGDRMDAKPSVANSKLIAVFSRPLMQQCDLGNSLASNEEEAIPAPTMRSPPAVKRPQMRTARR